MEIYCIFGLVFAAVFVVSAAKSHEKCEFHLCNSTDNYPEDVIESIASKHPKFTPLFGSVVKLHKKVKIDSRFNVKNDENLCPTRSMLVFPKSARNVNREWRTIVNVDNYQQAVQFEACLEGSNCLAEGKLPLGYKTRCNQQYIVVKMIAVNPETEELSIEQFPIPSGCSCVYSMEYK